MASFQAKIGWKRPRKRENKNYRSVPFRTYPTRNRKFRKNSKKIKKKLKNSVMALFQVKIGWKRLGNRENKKLSFRSVPIRCVIENSKKNCKKIEEIKKIPLWHHFRSK